MSWIRRRVRGWRRRRELRRDPELAARIAEGNRRNQEMRRRFAPVRSALCAGAGDEAELQAVEMLTQPPWWGFWLSYEGFLERFVRACGAPDARGRRPARVAWDEVVAALEAGALPAPESQQRLLWLAASMAVGVPISLRDCVNPGVIGWLAYVEAAGV